jgi:hypothetical protein
MLLATTPISLHLFVIVLQICEQRADEIRNRIVIRICGCLYSSIG